MMQHDPHVTNATDNPTAASEQYVASGPTDQAASSIKAEVTTGKQLVGFLCGSIKRVVDPTSHVANGVRERLLVAGVVIDRNVFFTFLYNILGISVAAEHRVGSSACCWAQSRCDGREFSSCDCQRITAKKCAVCEVGHCAV